VFTPFAKSLRSGLKIALGNALILGLLLLLVEGVSSYALVLHEAWVAPALAEQSHAEYDSELGWINKPNMSIPDMYGPGIYLKTNARRFREDQDTETTVPIGKRRIVCSGDSFTLGYGVSNAHTWCHLLTVRNPAIETVNMGQGGYGLDQAYLWYKRDGDRLEHHAQIVAFVTPDFERMKGDSFFQYGKPFIQVANGTMAVGNVPVPRRDLIPGLMSIRLGSIRTREALTRLSAWRRLDSSASGERGSRLDPTQLVVGKIFEDLKRLNDERSRKLVLVYIPLLSELPAQGTPPWVKFVEDESQRLGIPLLNLFDTFRALPFSQVAAMYIPSGRLKYAAAAGHLSEEGNQFVADIIYQKFVIGVTVPGTAALERPPARAAEYREPNSAG
jgi:hypothetical protein